MNILGISAFYHDSAACLVREGKIIAAAQEERFTRKKHDYNWPANAIEYCLKEGGIKGGELEYAVFYDKPFVKFERILESYLAYAPFGFPSFLKATPIWLKRKLWMKQFIADELGFEGKILFPEHHESHAASAFYPSPFQEAAFITVDGVGEWTTSSYGVGKGNALEILAEIKFPHSLGLLYSAFTYYTGFKVNSGEYKVMGLAPYGEPRYVQKIYDHLIDVKPDGSFKLNQKYFNYCAGLTMTSRSFHRLFGGPPRKPESEITQKEMDLAASAQAVTEDIILRMARHVRRETGMRNLCLAGGVALNCVANGKLLREGIFDRLWIQPAAGDAGGALGAALYAWHQYLSEPRNADAKRDTQSGSLLGPGFSDDEIENYLIGNNIPYRRFDGGDLPRKAAELLAEGKVVGWFNGRMEFGPRALGSRSILGDPRRSNMQSIMNLKIKFRESFRPFAPSVLEEKSSDYFDLDVESPYMLLTAPVREDRRIPISNEQRKLSGIDKLKAPRSQIPAVTHVDYSARVQTVNRETNPLYYELIERFNDITGCPLVINTSFNVRGEPIVCRPEEAYLCFMRTDMDFLVMGNFLLDKREQPPLKHDAKWRNEFELD